MDAAEGAYFAGVRTLCNEAPLVETAVRVNPVLITMGQLEYFFF
jgi:hypothetical protein